MAKCIFMWLILAWAGRLYLFDFSFVFFFGAHLKSNELNLTTEGGREAVGEWEWERESKRKAYMHNTIETSN